MRNESRATRFSLAEVQPVKVESRTPSWRSSRPWFTTSAVWVVLALLLTPWIFRLSPLPAILLTVQLWLALFGLIGAVRPRLQLARLVYFSFFLPWLTIAPIYQISHGVAAWGDPFVVQDPAQVTPALVLLLATTIAFLVGSELPRRTAAAEPEPAEPKSERTSWWGWPWLYVLACAALAPRAIAGSGGLAGLFTSRSERNQALSDVGLSMAQGGVVVALAKLLPAGLAVAAALLWTARIRQRRDDGLPLLLSDAVGWLVAVALVCLFANPYTNTRFLSAAAVGAIFLTWFRPRTARAGTWLALIAVLVTCVAYPYANVFRSSDQTVHLGFSTLAGDDFDGFQQVENTFALVHDVGFSFGSHFLSAAAFFVPRSIWVGKQIPASFPVAEHRGYAFGNLSLPFPAEAYLDFGVIGSVVVLFLLGWALRKVDERWADGNPRWALIAPYIAMAQLGLLRGPLGSNVPVYLTVIVLLALAMLGRRPGYEGRAGSSRPGHQQRETASAT